MNCKVCGSKLSDETRVCELCGSPVEIALIETAQVEMPENINKMDDNTKTRCGNILFANINSIASSSYSEQSKSNRISDKSDRQDYSYQINFKLTQGIVAVFITVVTIGIMITCILYNNAQKNTIMNNDIVTVGEADDTSVDKYTPESEQSRDYIGNFSNAYDTDSDLNGSKSTQQAVKTVDNALNHTAIKDVEPKVTAIREEYNRTQSNISTLTMSNIGKYKFYRNAKGYVERVDFLFDNEYSACYYYKDNQLYFAFVFDSNRENRFYFFNDTLFRWIDENKEIHDNDFSNSNYQSWWDEIVNEAKMLTEYL